MRRMGSANVTFLSVYSRTCRGYLRDTLRSTLCLQCMQLPLHSPCALIRSGTGHKLERRLDIDAAMQGPIQGTAHRISIVYFLDDAANVL